MALSYLDQPRAGRLFIQYAPAGGELAENPPRFTWVPVVEDEAQYCLRFSTDPQFADAKTKTFTRLDLNFFTPDVALEAGEYHWQYAVCDADSGAPVTEWSVARQFSVAEGLPQTPIPGRQDRYKPADMTHPRLWLSPAKLEGFKRTVASDPATYGWELFYNESVLPWMDREIMAEPAGYPNHKRVAPIWRQTYIDTQELMYAIRHLAVGGKVTDDQAMIDRAKAWLLSASDWDPAGTTSRSYTDEWAFRVNLALAWGYDWLHDQLSEEEHAKVLAALVARTRETAHHIIHHAKIGLVPFDSHAVRAVSAVLVPASIALLDHEPEARFWLDYSIEFLGTVYSPWGDRDGGWAEGPHYWMTGMAYLIDAANLLKAFCSYDLYQRPFFQKTGDFPLYTKAPDTRRATFGDDSTMGDLPSLKIGYNLRQYAGVTGNGAYQWYFDEIKRNDPGSEMAFYNWGWWDFRFDEIVYQHDFGQVEATSPSQMPTMRFFKGIGWVAIQHAMDKPDEHIQFVFKASPYGSISHSHGDQNAFCLAAFGEDLAIQSGHYVAFNSTMHQKWRRQTISKNAILINGNGQYAGGDKQRAMSASGFIVSAETHEDHLYFKGDATAAYQSLTPEVTMATRAVYFVNNQYFVIVDEIDAEQPVDIQWLYHANKPMTLGETTFRYEGERAGLYGKFLWSEAGSPTLSQVTDYPGVDREDFEGLPVSTCLTANFPKAIRHRIATLLVP